MVKDTGSPDVWILPSTGKTVRVPDGVALHNCRFRRNTDDLILLDKERCRVILRGYYAVDRAPYLRDGDGDLISGELARLLAGLSDHAVVTLMKRGIRNRNRAG